MAQPPDPLLAQKQASRAAAHARVAHALKQGDLNAVLETRNAEPHLISVALLRQAVQTGRADLIHALAEVAKGSVQRSALHATVKVGSFDEVLGLITACRSKTQSTAMKLLRTPSQAPWLIALAPHVHLHARRVGLLTAAKFRLWDACQVLVGLCDLAGAPVSVPGDFLSDCVAGDAPPLLMDQALAFSSASDREKGMLLAASLGHVKVMREILYRADPRADGAWLAKAGAAACAAGKQAALDWLLEHTTVEAIWKSFDRRSKGKPEILDRLGVLAPAATQAEWLDQFPDLLPMTAGVHHAEKRKQKAGHFPNIPENRRHHVRSRA